MYSRISSSPSLKSSGTTNNPSQFPAFGTPVTGGRVCPERRGRSDEPGHWPIILGDCHILARGETVNEFRQVGLCFLKGDRRHPEVSEGPWSPRSFYQTVRRRLDHRRVEHPVAEGGKGVLNRYGPAGK